MNDVHGTEVTHPAAGAEGAQRDAPVSQEGRREADAVSERAGLTAARAATKRHQLGVLFVHGIGTQPKGETLVRWSDALVKALSRATRGQVAVTVDRGNLGIDSSGTSPQAEVQICAGGQAEHWLLAEGWWARSFHEPSYKDLVSWGFRALPWSIALHIAQRYWQSSSGEGGGAKRLALVRAVGQLVLALACTPLLLVLLAMGLVLGLLPVPKIREMILSAQSVLTATVGDSLVFVESPVRAALIRTRILEALERLQESCGRTIVVAHSQGAAAVLDALGGIDEPEACGEGASRANPRAPGPVPDTLLTFGAGTNQLVSLKLVAAGLTKRIGNDPVLWAESAFLVTVGLLASLYVGLRAQWYSLPSLTLAARDLLVAGILLGLLWWSFHRLIGKLAGRWQAVRRRQDNVELIMMGILTLALLIAAIIYTDRAGHPLGPVSILLLAILMLGVSLSMILSRNMETVVRAPVHVPEGLARWIDIFASADPVPNGPTRIGEGAAMESIRIWNRGSFWADHTSYWDNVEGFVLRVIRACAETAQSPWTEQLPGAIPSVDERARWRVRVLRLASWSARLVWLFLFTLLWIRYGEHIPLPYAVPAWAPAGAAAGARFGVLAVVVGTAAWATLGLIDWLWTRWVLAEQEDVLTHGLPPAGMRWDWPVGMAAVFWMLVMLAAVVGKAEKTTADILRTYKTGDLLAEWGAYASIACGWAIISVFALRWVLPPPDPHREAAESAAMGVVRPE